jgi:hypothetical protein
MNKTCSITSFSTSVKYTCTLKTDTGEYVGSFQISDYMDIPSMNIDIEDEYQGKGYTRLMMQSVVGILPNWSSRKLLYIDADASSGFWKHIGMKENTNGNGYELVLSVRNLKRFINKV